DTVVFDKTGTLTLPDLDVVNAASIPSDMFGLAGRLALTSRHPVAAAVARGAQARAPLPGAVEEPGRGVRAVVDGVEARLGSPFFCGADGLANEILSRALEVSVVPFRFGTQCHVLAVRQQLRADAAAAIAALKARGIAVELLSGDREPAVHHAAQALGVAVWRAGMTPADKIARIEELKRRGRKGVMGGGSDKDAPSPAAASGSRCPHTPPHMTPATAH